MHNDQDPPSDAAIKQAFPSLYRTSSTSDALIHDSFPGIKAGAMSHPSSLAAAASLFGHPSVASSVGYPFPSLMAAVASSGVAPGDIATPGSTVPVNATGFQPGSPITPVPFRFGEFPFPGGLAAFRKFLTNLIGSYI